MLVNLKVEGYSPKQPIYLENNEMYKNQTRDNMKYMKTKATNKFAISLKT